MLCLVASIPTGQGVRVSVFDVPAFSDVLRLWDQFCAVVA